MNKCDVCEHDMYDTDIDCECVGIAIKLSGEHIDVQRVKDMFGKTDFAICFCCWLKSLGVKPINEELENE